MSNAGETRQIMTVLLEDYFQVGAFRRIIQRGQWYRFERRLERTTELTLDLLRHHDTVATFFVFGWVADTVPELIRQVAEAGHEIANRGFYPRDIGQMTPEEFRDDLNRAHETLERAAGHKVHGYRAPRLWTSPTHHWALDILAQSGYHYDSSVAPLFRGFRAEPWRRFIHTEERGRGRLTEIPLSSVRWLGLDLPVAGGNYFRQLPRWLVDRAVESWHSHHHAPFVSYFQTWELDPDQPKISAAPWLQRVRQYRHLDRMAETVSAMLQRYPSTSIANYLDLSLTNTSESADAESTEAPVAVAEQRAVAIPASDRTPVTVVIPCFNEELVLPYLANTLDSVETQLADAYDLSFVFVNDCSTDDTKAALTAWESRAPNVRVVHHHKNRGVAQAIKSGLEVAETEISCSIDCDCTYDPHELVAMIPLLTHDVDLVVASPYHPDGGVRNVPSWRLALSRGLSALYRLVLHHKLHTYTSCFRVYRRSATIYHPIQRPGFLGVAELLGRMDLAGSRIVEYPTTLEVRILGRSKMRVIRTVWGQLRLLGALAWQRVWSRRRPLPVPSVAEPPNARPHVQ